jgi:endonuclease YncB( thermonuclease family)
MLSWPGLLRGCRERGPGRALDWQFVQPRRRTKGPVRCRNAFRGTVRIAATLLALWMCGGVAKADITGPAFVQSDASLLVSGKRIRLFGIYVLETDRRCVSPLFPVRCKQRAALSLELQIERFVRCKERSINADRSVNAVCWEGVTPFSDKVDLAAWMLRQGWAVALPDAPFEYHVLERIARARGFGVWGLQVDSVQ